MSAYHKLIKEVYKTRLVHFEDIRGSYDFDTFLKSYRPPQADAGARIQKHFAIDLEVRNVEGSDRVFVRSKNAIGAKTKWSGYTQCYPSLQDLMPQTPHPPTTVPPPAPLKLWDDFDARIAPTLIR